MPDIQQIKSEYQKYRYSIPQLLELSCTACLPFDLSKFTYEAARAGVIPSLDNCTMSSRKSSASYTRAGNVDTSSNSDILLFQGNRVVHPGRQPKLPPPIERQKDEGFAKFLKKHASPTHNRVTAGGRIVPMEPRSPPVFALSSTAASQSQAIPGDQDVQVPGVNGAHAGRQSFEGRQQYETAEWDPKYTIKASQTTTLQPTTEPSDNTMPYFVPHHIMSSLIHPQMYTESGVDPTFVPMRAYLPEQHLGGPVMPHHVQTPPMVYNQYYSPSAVASTVPVSNEFGSSPTWSALEHILAPQNLTQHAMPAYQLLVAWEQHYIDLDVQLKNIDRHRAMHQLDPYLAEQRKKIVQQRSDAKDAIKEAQMMLGLRRIFDSSQDSFATSFNVDAPSYVPARPFESAESRLHAYSGDPVQTNAGIDKPKGNTSRRAIPIISPPKPSQEEKVTQQTAIQDTVAQDTDVDEWGVQNRPAPPEIHREQSRLSDMLQAEQRRSANGRDDISQYDRDSQSSTESQQGVSTNLGRGVADAHADPNPTIDPRFTPEQLPRDNAHEMQQVMDAIGRPKGTTTRVRLLDNRVIDVEGQGLELSATAQAPHPGWNASSKADTRHPTPALSRPKLLRDARMHANAVQTGPADGFTGKENMLAAPQGHQKAATDAFLAQFNAVEDNVALAAKADNRSLNIVSNGIVDDRKHSSNRLSASNEFLPTENVGAKFNNPHLRTSQDLFKRSLADQDSMSFQTATSTFADDLLAKGYSSVSVQNINAIGRLPQNLDGAVDARQIAQAHLTAVEKAKSPRLFKRRGANGGGAWYGPYCRDMFDRARAQSNTGRTARKHNA